MRKNILMAATAGLFTLAACNGMSRDEEMFVGALAGATLAIITADALDADPNWVVVAALTGAAVGSLVAIDRRNDRCAYARADGRYRVTRCR
ncbi:glucose-6-phosphate isomerase [Actibacterium sp. MT2.3-13A]|uniref:glucose-6-phosphate isomerase n=1 Tax=Actibacterium sp. MT2.3-13A TaxID=2828332 RepID=UPI001BA88F9C|nr:glucose-6-phosphate isomerase [Actibacterium sp. MT2.3-13A]